MHDLQFFHSTLSIQTVTSDDDDDDDDVIFAILIALLLKRYLQKKNKISV